MADHGDAPYASVKQSALFNFFDIPGVFNSSWSDNEFNGSDATREAPGFELVWVFSREGLEPNNTLDANAPVVPSVSVPESLDLIL